MVNRHEVKEMTEPEAPNYRHGGDCCCNCDHGILVSANRIEGVLSPMVKCGKYGFVIPGGVCDDWEED